MLRMPVIKRNKEKTPAGQTLLEYTVMGSIVLAALIGMSVFIRRGIQSVVKVTADQIGLQNEAEQTDDTSAGYLINSYTTVRNISSKRILERPTSTGAVVDYFYDGTRLEQTSDSLSNLGFRNNVR